MVNRKKILSTVLLSLSLVVIVSGCGVKPSSPSPSSNQIKKDTQSGQNMINPADNKLYGGADNYKKLEGLAAQNPKDDTAQISAGMSAYSNQDYDKAIEYYKKAIATNPNSGIAYNNIGNAYFRGKKDPKTALQYYVKATEVQPSYNYSWLNLALCQKALGDISGAKETASKGLKVLNSGDPLNQALSQLLTQLK